MGSTGMMGVTPNYVRLGRLVGACPGPKETGGTGKIRRNLGNRFPPSQKMPPLAGGKNPRLAQGDDWWSAGGGASSPPP